MDANDRPQPMFPEDEWSKGMTKEQRARFATNICASKESARRYNENKTIAMGMNEAIGAKVE